ncbi:ABC transporter substrate-binding protein [Nocardioides perillae]|uniref:Peptide/nickel transport system substrate-binding protein n=1 Tax=Nocardioides perillae TaxID=1119534 RepID=A0A7Y9RVI1_9ACTN|nr:ABC transporter substrate-binding protein [Nocardioides perillae]NYG56089.1 peptide/nickel transport system substrate-binding protein [Nocardioides perillae]
MKRSKPLAFVVGTSMLALAACGGGNGGSGTTTEREFGEQDGGSKDAEATGPVEIEGATEGGTVTVYLPGDPGPDTLDPTEGWSVTGNSIQQALTTRSLTQYKRNDDGEMVLVPDLATDLGTPNEDFTQWTFTIRDDATWEDGKPVTAEEVAFGIKRSLDVETFPGGPGTEYSAAYFAGADEYQGPYTEPNEDYESVRAEGNDVIIEMSKPFPDMDYWGAFMAMGPVPTGKVSNPPAYGQKPLSTGPYKIESFRPTEELVLVRNEQWDPASDPARTQYPDRYIFKFEADQNTVDQIFLSGNTDSQTAVSTGAGSANYARISQELEDRLVQQSSQCTSFLYPVYEKTTLNIRKAIAYGYDYENVWLTSGEVPGVTRVPANSIMPPGMAGKPDYFVDGEQITYQPERAKELLAEEGYEPGEYELRMIYFESDPLQVEAQKQLTAGLEEAGFKVTAIPTQDSPYNTWLDPDNKVNQSLNLRGVNWCSDWPSGLTMIPPLTKTDATYNTGGFSEPALDERMENVVNLPLEEQAAEWGAIDEEMQTEYFPIIPTAFRNDLFMFGEKIGNGVGDGAIGAPYYKGLFVTQ